MVLLLSTWLRFLTITNTGERENGSGLSGREDDLAGDQGYHGMNGCKIRGLGGREIIETI